MPRPSPIRPPPQAELTLDSVERQNPEWRPWLRLLRLTVAELDPGWEVDVELAPRQSDSAPLLHHAEIGLNENRMSQWLEALLGADSDSPFVPSIPERIDPTRLLEAAIRLDDRGIGAIAASPGGDPDALGVVAQIAAIPVLHACRHRVKDAIPTNWSFGYCPVCGTWPAFAEMRGLERQRRVRCGRCGSDWRMDVLRCPFCGELDHRQLGTLSVEGEETRTIDTCRSCMGYLKSFTTLLAVPDAMIAAEDAATLHLDLVARDRGFIRPDHPGFEIAVRVVPWESAR